MLPVHGDQSASGLHSYLQIGAYFPETMHSWYAPKFLHSLKFPKHARH